jgi:hypothetical protein
MSWQTTAKEIGKVVLVAVISALTDVIISKFNKPNSPTERITKRTRTRRKPRQIRATAAERTA